LSESGNQPQKANLGDAEVFKRMRKYLVFALISMALLLGSISGTSVSVAFPVIMTSFSTTLVIAGWVLSVNQLISTVAMPVTGKASDIFGRKSVFNVSLSLFTLGSLLCALAPNIWTLIFFRAIQALGMGGLMPASSGIVADYFPNSRQQMIGLFTSIFPIGQIIGPNLGGWLVESFGWKAVFWINVPLGIAVLVASAWLLRKGPGEEMSLDLAGTGLLTGSLFALMAGLSEIGSQQMGMPKLLIAILFAASIGFMVLFVLRESKVKNPIIDMAMMTKRPFLAANIYNFIYGACVLGISSLIPLYGVEVYSLSTLQSGLILTPRSVGMILMSTVTSVSLVRWGYRWPMLFGTIVTMVSLLLLGFEFSGANIAGIHLGNMVLLFGFLSLLGLGMGTAAPAANNACIELMPDRVATIIGIRGMFRQCGGAVSIAVATLVLHSAENMASGFRIVFFGSFLLMALTIPCIFLMPSSCLVPSDKPATG
jgi:EmrB/QacA subfamily drug resistance transporter